MRLATRIRAFEWLLVALLVSVSALSIELIRSASVKSAQIIRDEFSSLRAAEFLRETLWAYEVSRLRIRLGEARPQEVSEAREGFENAYKKARAVRLDPEEEELFRTIDSLLDRYFRDEIAVETALQAMAALIELNQQEMEEAAGNALAQGRTATNLIGAAGAIALLISIVLAWRTARNITRPLESLHRALMAIARGEVHRRVPAMPAESTISEISRSVNVLADRLERAERLPLEDRELVNSALSEVLERRREALIVFDLSATQRASNRAARELIERHTLDDLGITAALKNADEGRAPSEGAHQVEASRLRSSNGRPIGYLVEITPSPVTALESA
jgi:nitrogen fixation/metabolism regulation signal transduction histidine kinase